MQGMTQSSSAQSAQAVLDEAINALITASAEYGKEGFLAAVDNLATAMTQMTRTSIGDYPTAAQLKISSEQAAAITQAVRKLGYASIRDEGVDRSHFIMSLREVHGSVVEKSIIEQSRSDDSPSKERIEDSIAALLLTLEPEKGQPHYGVQDSLVCSGLGGRLGQLAQARQIVIDKAALDIQG